MAATLTVLVQFTVSMVVYNISRKFNHYGIVSHHTSPRLCRRGWEWYVRNSQVHFGQGLSFLQGSFRCLAILMEFLLRAIPALEDSHDT